MRGNKIRLHFGKVLGFLCVALAVVELFRPDWALLNSEIHCLCLLPPECWVLRCAPPPSPPLLLGLRFIFIIFIYVYVCICVHRYLKRPEEGVGYSGAENLDSCELPDVGAGNQML